MGLGASPASGTALLILFAAGAVPAAPAADQEFHGKRITLAEPPHSQLAAGHPVHPLGKELCIGGASFAMAGEGARLRVAPEPGLEPSIEITPGRPVRLSWTAGDAKRGVLLTFSRDESGAWSWWASEAVKFRIAGEDFRLYDGDGDGLYGDFANDGWSTGDTDQVIPLAREFPLGANLVSIRSIEPDGGRIVAETSALPGTGPQVAAVVLVNRLRASNGLPPAMLDGTLSAACTSHANYLAANGWGGKTNPHTQNLGPKGASPEGAAAAARSDIQYDPPDVALRDFWRTFYHRVGLMGPALDRTGVNTEPPGLTVVDIARGYGEGVTVPGVGVIRELTGRVWPWTDPVFVPADGSTGLPVAAYPELPKGPVPDFGSRGAPLMALFRGGSRVTGFKGTLEELDRKGPVPVPVLAADSSLYPFASGIVPAAPLRPRASYRAVFTWHSVDEDSDFRRTIRFRTE
jgi:hypothetical protein